MDLYSGTDFQSENSDFKVEPQAAATNQNNYK